MNKRKGLDNMKDLNAAVKFVENASGESGCLSKITAGCSNINDILTNTLDRQWSPNEVDSFDASCNTCKHFQRKSMTPNEKMERNIFGMPGYCSKKDIAVRGWQRGKFCGFENAECYENRRTGMRQWEACLPDRK